MTNGILECEEANTASKALGSSQGPESLYVWQGGWMVRGLIQTQVMSHLPISPALLREQGQPREVRRYLVVIVGQWASVAPTVYVAG